MTLRAVQLQLVSVIVRPLNARDPPPDEADMREVSHFLLELKNGSGSRDVCEIPPAVPENEVVPGSGSEAAAPPASISLDPLQSASPEARVSISG